MYRTGDVLEAHRKRLPALPNHVWAETVPPGAAELDTRIIELLDERAPGTQAGWRYRHAATSPGIDQETNYVDIGEQQIAVTTAGSPSKPMLMVLHDLAGSAASVSKLVSASAADHYVICPDLPGHGESADCAGSGFSIDKTVDALSRLLAWSGKDNCHLLSLGASCVFIPSLVKNNPRITIKACMHNPLLLDVDAGASLTANFAPAIKPDNYGTFITKLWYALRDGRLFWPWYEPVASNIRRHTPSLAAADVHQSLFDALRCGNRYHLIWQAFFATDVIHETGTLSQSLAVTLSRTHPCYETALASLGKLANVTCKETSDDWSDVIDAHFG